MEPPLSFPGSRDWQMVRAGMTADEIECIEEGGAEPAVARRRRLAAALDADVGLIAGS